MITKSAPDLEKFRPTLGKFSLRPKDPRLFHDLPRQAAYLRRPNAVSVPGVTSPLNRFVHVAQRPSFLPGSFARHGGCLQVAYGRESGGGDCGTSVVLVLVLVMLVLVLVV